MSPWLQCEDFARAEHQEFDVFVGDATVTMTLVWMESFKTPQGLRRSQVSGAPSYRVASMRADQVFDQPRI